MAEKPFWEKGLPKGHKEKHLTKKQEQSAKAHARAAGRPYPAVDNILAARKSKTK